MPYAGHEKDIQTLGAHIENANRTLQILQSDQTFEDLIIIVVTGRPGLPGPSRYLTSVYEMQLLLTIGEEIESHATQLRKLATDALKISQAIIESQDPAFQGSANAPSRLTA